MNPSYNQPQMGQANTNGVPSNPYGPPPTSGVASQSIAMPGSVPVTNIPGNMYAPQTRSGSQQPGVIQTPVAAPKSNPNSTQNALQMAEIRDGIVIMNDGSFRSIIMVKSINFDLMSPEEREAVEFSYQGFLNSLYFPIQITIRSQKVDLGPYIQKLDKIRSEHDNMLLAVLMDDYINYMDTISQQVNIMDKKFYVVIPYYPVVDVQKALSSSKGLVKGVSALFSKKAQNHVTECRRY